MLRKLGTPLLVRLGDQMKTLGFHCPSRVLVLWSESSLTDSVRNFRGFRTQRSSYFRRELQKGGKRKG